MQACKVFMSFTNLNLCYARRKLLYTSVQCRDAAEFSGSELISDGLKDSGNVCCGQKSPYFNMFWGKKLTLSSQPQRGKGPSKLSSRWWKFGWSLPDDNEENHWRKEPFKCFNWFSWFRAPLILKHYIFSGCCNQVIAVRQAKKKIRLSVVDYVLM